MNYKIILIITMLVMIAAPAMACPPQFWVDKVNWQKANNYTEFNATCWIDGQGNYHNVTIESVTDQNNIFGYKYGDYCQWTTVTMDGKVIINSFENLDASHRAHEAMQSPLQNMIITFGSSWPCLCIPALFALILMGLSVFIPKGKDKDNK